MQPLQHPAQAAKNAAALDALSGVSLQAQARPRRKVAVEIIGHMAWSPSVISPETCAVQKAAHVGSDPTKT